MILVTLAKSKVRLSLSGFDRKPEQMYPQLAVIHHYIDQIKLLHVSAETSFDRAQLFPKHC